MATGTAKRAAGGAKGGVESGASKATSITEDQHKAIVIAGLERAVKQIETTMTNIAERVPEGSYPVRIEVHVTGDITVAQARAGEIKSVLDFRDRDLCAAFLSTIDPTRRKAHIESAIKAMSKARVQAEAQATLLRIDGELTELVQTLATRHGLTCKKCVGARAGSTAGKPTVCVKADVREHSVSFAIGV